MTTEKPGRTGVWLIGARGSVATTTVVGALAVREGLAGTTGMVTALEPFTATDLPEIGELVFGGHDIAEVPWGQKAEVLVEAGVLPAHVVQAVAGDLKDAEGDLRPAPVSGHAGRDAERIADDLTAFAERHGLDRTVVVHVASTEPAAGPHPSHQDADALAARLAAGEAVLPPSSLYAWAAMAAGCAYVDFTPSTGARLPALAQLADRQRVPFAGRDGKTGETLVKSVLAPMFALRNLRVGSWSSVNLLGGGDGATLAEPGANTAKTASKTEVLHSILGYLPEGQVRIDEVADLGDAKTAWDLVTFTGFLGARMRLDFTWSGIDSALAAPLVLDLARLTSRAHQVGRAGALEELAFFFKDPHGHGPHDLPSQWHRLCAFAAELAPAA
ncbi:inositol-3-phosphate synthase [Streptomyces olivoreticuli]|uniref:inositol-3-phosphate synthase n=1 Tax=Streptomyces olivoreticuli TaxID=68246 RepID=UPI00265845F7|nr:inositol-3-phosphate synthase [Streptomyces olivoreticuli]WKK24241.1 inositol-3-phosphate synthase [Streptomyces olivoreticuli]